MANIKEGDPHGSRAPADTCGAVCSGSTCSAGGLSACLCVWEGGPSTLEEQEASGGRLRCWVPMPCLKPYRGTHTEKAVRQGEERGLPVSFDLAKLQLLGNVCPARARRATFVLTIPTSAPDLPSHGEAPQVDHIALHTFPTKHVAK